MSVLAFYYGSYMDPEVLRKFGANPADPVRATLPGWRLAFTPHANLIRSRGGAVEGVVYELEQEALDKLYGPEGYVTTYHPTEVEVVVGGKLTPMISFIEEAAEAAPSPNYAAKLLKIMAERGLPAGYIDSVRGSTS